MPSLAGAVETRQHDQARVNVRRSGFRCASAGRVMRAAVWPRSRARDLAVAEKASPPSTCADRCGRAGPRVPGFTMEVALRSPIPPAILLDASETNLPDRQPRQRGDDARRPTRSLPPGKPSVDFVRLDRVRASFGRRRPPRSRPSDVIATPRPRKPGFPCARRGGPASDPSVGPGADQRPPAPQARSRQEREWCKP